MGYPDYPIPENEKSYLTRSEIVDFLNSYCDYFQLRKFISVSFFLFKREKEKTCFFL